MQASGKPHFDLIVVGGGILGIFHAYHALNAGLKVALFEKNTSPQGATVRNFGQIVPSGMNRKWQRLGRESLRIYQEIQQQFDISVRREGSIYLASDEKEMTLLEELSVINQSEDYPSQLLSQTECVERYPGLKSDYCRGGLFFPEEITVNPRLAAQKILAYLLEQKGLQYFHKRPIIDIHLSANNCWITDSHNQSYLSEKVIVCNGSDFQLLFPKLFAQSDLEVSKLQMMQTVPQPRQKIPGSVLTGLSIRRYESFVECPSRERIKAAENPDSFERRFGVHILFKQAVNGSVIIGDSHEYADAAQKDSLGFDLNTAINQFILQEAQKIFDLEDWTIQQSWFGMYSQSKNRDIFQHQIENRIHIVTGIGGKGMTGSPGFAKENLNRIMEG